MKEGTGPEEVRVEICVDSVEGAVAAQEGGAHRVELCANLLEGGTTPSGGCIAVVRKAVQIGVQVMIRPRGADFLYSRSEVEVMREDIRLAKTLGANGVVFGCLTSAGEIDAPLLRELIEVARPMSVTFHRAFDMCRDPWQGLNALLEAGVDRLLTSGQEDNCVAGLGVIGELNRRAAEKMIVMPGGGLHAGNIERVVGETGVREVHLSARRTVQSGMEFRNERVFMGGVFRPPEYSWKTTDSETVIQIRQRIGANKH